MSHRLFRLATVALAIALSGCSNSGGPATVPARPDPVPTAKPSNVAGAEAGGEKRRAR